MKNRYHYTESGLDTVFLVNGYDYKNTSGGRTVIIKDVDGLQRAIGITLATKRHRLTGKEFRFLRSELLLSQSSLAKLLGVKELTVGRWERGESEIPLSAEAVVRAMFAEAVCERKTEMRSLLEQIADLDDELDRIITMDRIKEKWAVREKIAA